jgi:hypothetical protein
MHYKDPAVSVRNSQDCGNLGKPACTKVLRREKGIDVPLAESTDQSHLGM